MVCIVEGNVRENVFSISTNQNNDTNIFLRIKPYTSYQCRGLERSLEQPFRLETPKQIPTERWLLWCRCWGKIVKIGVICFTWFNVCYIFEVCWSNYVYCYANYKCPNSLRYSQGEIHGWSQSFAFHFTSSKLLCMDTVWNIEERFNGFNTKCQWNCFRVDWCSDLPKVFTWTPHETVHYCSLGLRRCDIISSI